jgi:hypothetical protein
MGDQSREMERWRVAGVGLCECDPLLLSRLLDLAERAVAAHRDPLSLAVSDAGDDLVAAASGPDRVPDC